MVENLFEGFRDKPERDRRMTVFSPASAGEERDPKSQEVVEAFDDIDEVNELLDQAIKKLVNYAEVLVVPIGDDENEVRAAHLRQGGDGKNITFAQFMSAVNETKRSRADYILNHDLTGSPSSDQRVVERSRMTRGLRKFAVQSGANLGEFSDMSTLTGFGLQGLLLFGLNELIGINHSKDHAAITAAKLPPGTESAGITSQIIRSIIMMRFLHGMTEEASRAYADINEVNISGVDLDSVFKDAYSQGPPASRSFELLRSGLSASDHELLVRHSSAYAASHIGDGFETWYAYLTTRELHERGLRESANARAYRSGTYKGSDKRAIGITKLANAGIGELARIQKVLGNGMSAGDACCLTRFLLAIDVDFLGVARTILEMSLAVLEAQASIAFNHSIDLMMSPIKMARSEILGILDGVVEDVISKVLEWSNLEGPIADILRACTPVSELFTSVIDQVEWIQNWYTEMLSAFEDDTEAWIELQGSSWEAIGKIKSAKEQLRILIRLIDEREAMVEASLPESQILGIVEEVRGYSQTYDIDVNTYEQIISGIHKLATNELSESERDEALNRIESRLRAAGVNEQDREHLRSELSTATRDKDDTKLNEALSYVEELVGDNTAGEGFAAINQATREMIEWCRTMGDWDRLKGFLGAKEE